MLQGIPGGGVALCAIAFGLTRCTLVPSMVAGVTPPERLGDPKFLLALDTLAALHAVPRLFLGLELLLHGALMMITASAAFEATGDHLKKRIGK